MKGVKGRAIRVLIGSDIWQKKGLVPPLLFLLYSHQVQTKSMGFRSFSPQHHYNFLPQTVQERLIHFSLGIAYRSPTPSDL